MRLFLSVSLGLMLIAGVLPAASTATGAARPGSVIETDALTGIPFDASPFPTTAPHSRILALKLHDNGTNPGFDRVRRAFGVDLLRQNPVTGVLTVQAPAGIVADRLAAQLASHPDVAWAEPVKWRRIFDTRRAALEPNEAQYGISQRSYYQVAGLPDAWGTETGSPNTVVAVIDSGVMCAHEDLLENLWVNSREVPNNGIDDDGNGFIDDVNGFDFVGTETGADESPTADAPGDGEPCVKAGDPAAGNGQDDDQNGQADSGVFHGTVVAGVAAAVTNNGKGVAGTCWRCKIMPVRVANPEGWVRSTDTADGITYAARNGARVINVSLGGPEISQAERAAIDAAVNTFNAVIVAAAGNENRHPVSFPAQLPNVIAVGASARATTNSKGRAPFSNWGTGGPDNRAVDVVAPGEGLASTSVRSVADQQAGSGTAGSGTYTSASGTSFAAPLVSGVAALMLSRNPSLTPAEVQANLRQTATPLGDDPGDSPDAGPAWAGAGLIDAAAAVNAVQSTQTPTPTATAPASTSPTATPTASATATATVIATPSAVVTPSATPTPLPAGATPAPLAPASGAALTGLGTTLAWNAATGVTQFQVQVVPANNDGPAINLIRNAATSYVVEPPVAGQGPYVMLPGITYSWRVRTTTATVGIDESSPLWGPWSAQSTFKTRSASSTGITAVAPAEGATVGGLTPTLQWAIDDPAVFYYEVQLSKDNRFGESGPIAMVYWELRHGAATNPLNSYAVPQGFPLERNTTYFWRVRPRIQGDGVPVAWSKLFSFRAAG